MKKFRLVGLALLLCLSPCTTMFACTVKSNYLITASSSDTVLGIVEGMDNNNEKLEGTTITLKAKERNGSFVCWVKNNEEIVNSDEENATSLTLVYGKETAGAYTAIFRDGNNYQNMLYATITSVSASEAITNLEITWSRQDIQDEQTDKNSILLPNGLASTITTTISTNKVYYFGKLGQDISYRFSAKITASTSVGTNVYYANFTTLLSKNSDFQDTADIEGNSTSFTMTGSYGDNKTINLVFSKL